MTRAELIQQIKTKKTFLCVGLDPDLAKIPESLMDTEDPIFEFCKQIVDATAPYCVCFKPNNAFFEAYGLAGMASMEKTIRYIKEKHPQHFVISDAKRGDIGNTSTMYAKAVFEHLNADAITVAPYMGKDSVAPFLQFPGKWAIVLALTSNEGSSDFQLMEAHGTELYKQVLEKVSAWGTEENLMFVVGATKATMLTEIRALVPDHFLLVPGVGAQGGSLSEVCRHGLTEDVGLLINSSRGIIYASNGNDFAQAAAAEAAKIAKEMSAYF